MRRFPAANRSGGGFSVPSLCCSKLRWATATALATLAVAVTAVTAAAAAPSGGSFGISPAPSGNGSVEPYFIMGLAAGGSTSADALVTNQGTTTQKLKISAATGVTAGNGGSAFTGAFEPCSGPGCWVTGLPATVTLAPETAEVVRFTVHVPPGTRPGQYLAGITVAQATAPSSVAVGSAGTGSARAVIVEEVTVGVAVTVGRLATLDTRLRIPSVFGSAIGPLPRLNIVLANTGQTFTRAAGNASCTTAGKTLRYEVLADTVLPGDQATIPANGIGLPAGSPVSCTVRLRYGRGQVVTWTGQVTIPAVPRARIVHTGPGAYAVVPAGGIPAWAIALIVIGGLLLAGVAVLLVLLVLRLRREPPRPETAAGIHEHASRKL
jgi:hypothetical protein